MQKPFFARYLEAQKRGEGEQAEDALKIKTGIKSGRISKGPVTLKYPSDSDEGYDL